MKLKLLVEADKDVNSSKTIQLNGKTWCLLESLSYDLHLPLFTCVSYVWGDGRRPNPFYPGILMSDRTLSALSTTMQDSETPAFWIDAFCIPPDQPQKRTTLESMGFIYSKATEVVVSLDSSTSLVLKQMAEGTDIPDRALETLEQDAWVESVWAYQEVINSHKLKFVPRNRLGEARNSDTVVRGEPFLGALGTSLQRYKRRHEVKDLDVFTQFPRIDALEETLSDWIMAGYVERSALQIMANMDRRRAIESKYRFYSMIGSLTQDPCQRTPATTVMELAETFMQLCEQKNDFSFIFSSAPRTEEAGRSWRPRPGFLPSILSWHCSGAAQKGHYDEAGFWLKDMLCLHPSSQTGEKGLNFLLGCVRSLGRHATEDREDAITESMLDILRRVGFTGGSSSFKTPYGIFFPQECLSPSESSSCVLIVSTQIAWTFGAPGFAKLTTANGFKFIPGVFAGAVLHTGPEVANDLVAPGVKFIGHSRL